MLVADAGLGDFGFTGAEGAVMADLNQGDVITIDGVYPEKSQKWRVGYVETTALGDRFRLIPLHDDESVDEFNDVAGEYWIEPRT